MIGFFSAISAVFLWTFACSIWRRESNFLLPRQINIYKNVLASILFFPVVITISWLSEINYIFILVISGIIGIASNKSVSSNIINSLKRLEFE